MNTLEINKHLKDLQSFKGTYPIDKIKKFRRLITPFSIVVNLDPHYMPGSHWVAIHIDKKNVLYYFDSFGRKFPKMIEDYFIKYNIRKKIFNKHKFQSINSQTCGAYTILFLKLMNNGFEFGEILKLFTKDSKSNDDLTIRALL